MRIAVIGPSGSGKTWLSAQLAETLGLRHVEIDASGANLRRVASNPGRS
jgi:adenylate kinase family enzyme